MKTVNAQKTEKPKITPIHPVASAADKKDKKTQTKAQDMASSDNPKRITHEMIAQRAKAIWMAKGCLPGQDEQNWYQAERELKAERKQN